MRYFAPPPLDRLSHALAQAWWLILLRGIAALAFGVLTLVQPGVSAAVLLLFFAIYAMVDGVAGVWTAISSRKSNARWKALLLWGVVSILAGALALVAPELVMVFTAGYLAFWAIVTGVLQIFIAIRLRQEMSGEWMLIVAGLLSVLFGILLVLQPIVGLLSVLWLVGLYAVLFGALLVTLAFRVRGLKRH